MPQLETAIVGKNNTKAGVTGQNELLVRVNSTVNQDTVIISPLGNQPEAKISIWIWIRFKLFKL